MRYYNTPIISYVGLCLFSLTLTVNLCFRLIKTSDVGIAMLLSLANAALLVFSLLWSFMGIIEFRILLKLYLKNKTRILNRSMNNDEFIDKSKKLRFCFTINFIYVFFSLMQLGYLIFNWDEVNI